MNGRKSLGFGLIVALAAMASATVEAGRDQPKTAATGRPRSRARTTGPI